jgi:hypothetical protein
MCASERVKDFYDDNLILINLSFFTDDLNAMSEGGYKIVSRSDGKGTARVKTLSNAKFIYVYIYVWQQLLLLNISVALKIISRVNLGILCCNKCVAFSFSLSHSLTLSLFHF